MRRDQDGFMLLEVLVAGLLITVTLLGVAAMMTTSYRQLATSGEQTSAVALSEQRIEWLRNQDYTSSAMSQGVSQEQLTGDYAGFARLTKIVDDSPRAGVKAITVVTTTPRGTSTSVSALVAEP